MIKILSNTVSPRFATGFRSWRKCRKKKSV